MNQVYVVLEHTSQEPLHISAVIRGHDFAVRRFKELATELFTTYRIPVENYEPSITDLWHHSDCNCELRRAGSFVKIFMQVYDVESLPTTILKEASS